MFGKKGYEEPTSEAGMVLDTLVEDAVAICTNNGLRPNRANIQWALEWMIVVQNGVPDPAGQGGCMGDEVTLPGGKSEGCCVHD